MKMMDLTGQIHDIQIDFKTRKPILSMVIEEDISGIDDLIDKKLSIKLGLFKRHRSLDSNAYFHVLCDKLRQKLGISMAACKNELITSYGQIWYIGEESWIYKTNAEPEFIRELETVHMELIKIGDDGAYWYRVYRGSHTYDSAEMAKLIEGTIEECKAQGIETATPDEIARMQELWERHRRDER